VDPLQVAYWPLAVQTDRRSHCAALEVVAPERTFPAHWASGWIGVAPTACCWPGLRRCRRWHCCLWRWTSCWNCCSNWIWAGRGAGPCHYSTVCRSSWAAPDSHRDHCTAVCCPPALDMSAVAAVAGSADVAVAAGRAAMSLRMRNWTLLLRRRRRMRMRRRVNGPG